MSKFNLKFAKQALDDTIIIADKEASALPYQTWVAMFARPALDTIAELESELKANAQMLAEQHDRNMELETKILELEKELEKAENAYLNLT